MEKKLFIGVGLLFLALLAAFSPSEAYDVTVVKSADIAPYNQAVEGFKSVCDNCVIRQVVASHSGDEDFLSTLRNSRTDLIFAIGLDAVKHVQAIRDIPVVYAMVLNPPPFLPGRGNMHGVSMSIPVERQLTAMTEIFPGIKRIGAVYDSANSEQVMKEAARIAEARGLELVLRKAQKPGDVPALIDSLKDGIDLFWMLPDATVVTSEAANYLFLFSFRNKVPVFTFSKKYVDMGAVAGLSIDPFDIGAQSAEIARRVLRDKYAGGPLRLEVRKTSVSINRKVAAKLGVRVREDLTQRSADGR